MKKIAYFLICLPLFLASNLMAKPTRVQTMVALMGPRATATPVQRSSRHNGLDQLSRTHAKNVWLVNRIKASVARAKAAAKANQLAKRSKVKKSKGFKKPVIK